MDLTTAVLSGTDNGIIKTTETVFFDLGRFASHLKLYNRFQILEDIKDADNADGSNTDETDILEHLTLPRALTLGSKQINQDTGLASFTNSLTRKKKTTEDGAYGTNLRDFK
ncbi:hypothetical protein BD408DRAFT_481351 [Parasitella parasitica]|nr:hypothetical protein BD408DRAFT_481351 [Parasitella parasitica]